MLVRDIMTTQVVAIDPDLPIRDATALMTQRGVRHFPVVRPAPGPDGGSEAGTLVGIVSDRDLRTVGSDHPDADPSVGVRDPVAKVMRSPVLTAHPLEPIEETARAMRDRRVGAMPVMDGDDLVGIVTSADLLSALVRMTGVGVGVSRLEVELPDRPGALAGLLDRIASRNASVTSVMSARSEPDAVTFVLHVATINGPGLTAFLRDEGFTVLWPGALTDDVPVGASE